MPVKPIGNQEEFKSTVTGAGGRLIVIDCFATWCGPCKMIAPYLEQLSTEYGNVLFLKVDVDEQEEIAQELGVEAMPTFKFIKGGKVIDTVVGADKAKLKATIDKHK
ncbi:hypothetical protein LSH36_218g04021 [Paralvinella palmiformis]|uniref:Thioredoxin n=1 Tax=Paralvinella palmiformis TaxID=53620 RepID=A0AAD9JNZ3_9ANNE|nr:hypothetical protein LSH36_218g04021 [Paralvinella palmiformis]